MEEAANQNENVDELICELGKDIGVNISPNDISVAHRNGPFRNGAPRPILCRFVSRKHRDLMITNRQKLKLVESRKKVFIYEDLTALRSKLLGVVKKQGCVHHAYTINGRIMAFLKDTKDPAKFKDLKKVSIESPDDLFKLDMVDIPMAELGLHA